MGTLTSVGDAPTEICESVCVHESITKRIANIRFPTETEERQKGRVRG